MRWPFGGRMRSRDCKSSAWGRIIGDRVKSTFPKRWISGTGTFQMWCPSPFAITIYGFCQRIVLVVFEGLTYASIHILLVLWLWVAQLPLANRPISIAGRISFLPIFAGSMTSRPVWGWLLLIPMRKAVDCIYRMGYQVAKLVQTTQVTLWGSEVKKQCLSKFVVRKRFFERVFELHSCAPSVLDESAFTKLHFT